MTFYIHPFVLGVITTVLAEFTALIVWAMVRNKRK